MGERKSWGDATVKNSQAKAYLDGYKIDGTGTASILIGSHQAVLTDNGVGDYTITFNQPYAREVLPVVSMITSGLIAEVFSVSKSAVRIKITDPQLKAIAYSKAYTLSLSNAQAQLYAAAYNLSFGQFVGEKAADAVDAAAFDTAFNAGKVAAQATADAAGDAAVAAGVAAAIVTATAAAVAAAAAVTGLADGDFELHILGFQYAQEF